MHALGVIDVVGQRACVRWKHNCDRSVGTLFLCKNERRGHSCPCNLFRGCRIGGCRTGKDFSSARAACVEGRVLGLWFVAENQAASMTWPGIRD